MADALGTGGAVVSAVDHRLDQAGLIAPQTSSLAVRTGVMWGPGSTAVITGTSATGTMTVNVAAHHWVTTRATGDGVYLGTKETSTTVNIAAAPGSNSRIDLVYAKQLDAGSTISADGSTAESYAVVTGTAAASPLAPSLPVGAVEVGRLTVAAGATNTLGAGVTISNTAPQTVARGAPVPVSTAAMRDALTKFTGLAVVRLDLGGTVERWDGVSRWAPYSTGDRTIGTNSAYGSGALGTGPSWNDILSVTGTSSGGTCEATFNISAFNGNSGNTALTAIFRVVVDGSTVLWTSDTLTLPWHSAAPTISPTRVRFGHGSSTPSAGSHTWKIQGQASAGSSAITDSASIKIVEQ